MLKLSFFILHFMTVYCYEKEVALVFSRIYKELFYSVFFAAPGLVVHLHSAWQRLPPALVRAVLLAVRPAVKRAGMASLYRGTPYVSTNSWYGYVKSFNANAVGGTGHGLGTGEPSLQELGEVANQAETCFMMKRSVVQGRDS